MSGAITVQRRGDIAGEELSGTVARFVEDHTNPGRQLSLRLADHKTYRPINGLVRYTRGDTSHGFSLIAWWRIIVGALGLIGLALVK